MALVATGSMTLTVTGAQIILAVGTVGTICAFARNVVKMKQGLSNNQHQNEQWKEAMRRLDIDNKDLRDRLHKQMRKYPYNTHDDLDKLVELLKEILKK